MFYPERRILVPLLLCVLTVICLFTISGSAGAADEVDLTKPGEYKVGYFYEYNETIGGYELDLKYYYPATSDGEETEPDKSGAPYPTVMYFVNWVIDVSMDIEMEKEYLELMASHGIVVLVWGNISMPPPNLVVPIIREYFDHMEVLIGNVASPLNGMVIEGAYGLAGVDMGGVAVWSQSAAAIAEGENRIVALHSASPNMVNNEGYIGPYVDRWNQGDAAVSFQTNEASTIIPFAYQSTTTQKCLITIKAGSTRGQYRYDLMTADLLWRVGGKEEF